MAIANRLMATQNQITEHRRNNPVVLSPLQQELISALSKRDELRFLLANKPSEAQVLAQLEEVETELEVARHEKAVLQERIRLRNASKPQATNSNPAKPATKQFVVPAGMNPVLASILQFQYEEQNQ